PLKRRRQPSAASSAVSVLGAASAAASAAGPSAPWAASSPPPQPASAAAKRLRGAPRLRARARRVCVVMGGLREREGGGGAPRPAARASSVPEQPRQPEADLRHVR